MAKKKESGRGCFAWVWQWAIRIVGGGVLLLCGLSLLVAVFNGDEGAPLPTRAALLSETRVTDVATVATETDEPTETDAEPDVETDTPAPSSTWTDTPTITATATVTDTPAPSATPSLETLAMQAFADVFGASRVGDIELLIVNDLVVTIRFPLTDLSAWAARREAELRLPQLVCAFREKGLIDQNYQITGTIAVVDAFGNTRQVEGVETIVPYDIVAQINCEAADQYNVNLEVIAARYDVHPLLQDN